MKMFLIGLMLLASTANATKIQKQGIKTSAECIAAGGTDANCLPDSGQVYVTNFSKTLTQSITDGDLTSSIASDSSLDFINCSTTASISANTLIVALKDKAGSDPSGGSPCKIGFRNSSATTGSYSSVSFSSSNSITLGATDSIGLISGQVGQIYEYLISDTTSEICLSRTPLDEGLLQSASALTGGADTTARTLWCTSAHASKPVRLIGVLYETWSNPNHGSIASNSVVPIKIGKPHLLVGTSVSSMPNSACTDVVFTSIQKDTGYNYATGTGLAIAPLSGSYRVSGSCQGNATPSGGADRTAYGDVRVNGSDTKYGHGNGSNGSVLATSWFPAVSAQVNVSAGDTLNFAVCQALGVSLPFSGSSNADCWMDIEYVGSY